MEENWKMKIVDDYFGCNVFSLDTMQKYLPHSTYKIMKDVMENGKELPKEIADIVANAMKDWAIEKRSDTLHTLVPTNDRNHRRKA